MERKHPDAGADAPLRAADYGYSTTIQDLAHVVCRHDCPTTSPHPNRSCTIKKHDGAIMACTPLQPQARSANWQRCRCWARCRLPPRQDGAVDRVTAAGYRSDWRGVVAYLFSPESWRAGPYVAFLALAAALVVVVVAQGATAALPVVGLSLRAACCYLFPVRPVLRLIARRRQISRTLIESAGASRLGVNDLGGP